MKFLLLAALLLVAYLLWRHARTTREPPPRGGTRPGAPQEMVRCPVCGVHLPRAEALTGADGLPYCSPEHRRLRSGG